MGRAAGSPHQRTATSTSRGHRFRQSRATQVQHRLQLPLRPPLQIPPQNRRFSFARAKIQLYQALDGQISLYYGDTRLEHTVLRDLFSRAHGKSEIELTEP